MLDDFEDNDIFLAFDNPAGYVNWGPNPDGEPSDLMELTESSFPYQGSYSVKVVKTDTGYLASWIRGWEDSGLNDQIFNQYDKLTMWVYDDDNNPSEFILQHTGGGTYDSRAYTSGKGWSRLVFDISTNNIFASGTTYRRLYLIPGGGHSGTYYIDDVELINCTCSSGPCCDGCSYYPSTKVCDENISTDYGCPWGITLGYDVGIRKVNKHCTGESTVCNGNLSYTGWEVNDYCTSSEICRDDYPSCTDPAYECYIDSECGTDEWVGQEFCSEGNVYQNYSKYTCHNPGTGSSSCSSSTSQKLKERCLHACLNGDCIYQDKPPYLFPEQKSQLEEIFEQHMEFFLSSQATTVYGFPLTAYRTYDRARYGYNNPTEWGYLLQAYIAAAERGIITKQTARSKISTTLSTINTLQNDPTENYQGLFYPYYKVTTSGGADVFPYNDGDPHIPSIDNGLLYLSLLITEGWGYKEGYSDIASTSKTIKDNMNYGLFIFEDNKISHQYNVDTGQLNTGSYWNFYPDEGGLMSFIMYIIGDVNLQGYEGLINNQQRLPASWYGHTIQESAYFNAMFAWSVRSLGGMEIVGTPYSTESLVPNTKAMFTYGDYLEVDYPGWSDAMTQAYNGESLTKYHIPPNLPGIAPSEPPTHITPHAFFVPFNVLPDLNKTIIEQLLLKISLLQNDTKDYYRDSGTYDFGFTVTASPYRNDDSFTGTDAGKNVFETLANSYTSLSIFNALQMEENKSTFYDYAKLVPGYNERFYNATDFLYPNTYNCNKLYPNNATCFFPRCYQDTDCDDGIFCNGEETCSHFECKNATPVDCSANDEDAINSCNYDQNPFTFEYYQGFASICNEATKSCTTTEINIESSCNMSECNAECQSSANCINKCIDELRYYDGVCDNCSCNYDIEDCTQYNNWHNTSQIRNYTFTECQVIEQFEQEFHDYICQPTECDYSITDIRWINTSKTHLVENYTCDICTPNWIEINSTCQVDDKIYAVYNDTNDCYAQTGFLSDNNPPDNTTYVCDYCTPSMTNTSWSNWQDDETCQIDDTIQQSRTRTEYDQNGCNEIANQTYTEYQDISCDYCTPELTNTSWSN
ncbi:MAG: hypothetical protein KJ601_08125, partial [Nanoarchaeota archaeon]|nr:hypothetical protein [Nanoarchaeota archaeon]